MAERALATAFVNVVPGTKDFETMLKAQLNGTMPNLGQNAGTSFGAGFKSKFSSAIRGVAAPLIAAFGVAEVGRFFNGAIQGASDLNEQGAAVGQVFGKGAGAIQKFADGAASSLGQSSVQILEASKQFGIYGKAAGLAGNANADFSKEMVQLATDLASFNNTSVDDAILALGSGLRGEAEPLRKYGVLLNDNVLKAEALKLGLIKTTKDALTPQQKVLAAHAVILAQTKTQQGDFARTSSGLANQQRILTAEWDNAQAILGQALIPSFTTLVSSLNTSVIPAIGQFFQDFKDGKTPLNDVVNSIGQFFTWVKDNWSWIQSLGVALLSAYAAIKLVNTGFAIAKGIQLAYAAAVGAVNGVIALWKLATGQATLSQLGLNAAMLANPIGLVIAAVAALVAGLIWFFTQTDVGKKAWATFSKFLGDTVKNIGKWFASTWQSIVAGWNNVVAWFQALPGKIMGFLKDAGNWLVSIGKNIIDGLINGLKSGITAVGSAVGDIANSVIGKFKSLLGIHSPSKVFHEFGVNILDGLKEGLTSDASGLQSTMKKVADWVSEALWDKKITKASAAAASALVGTYSSKLGGLVTEHDAVLKKLEAAQNDLAKRLDEKARMIDAISSKYGAGSLLGDSSTAKSVIEDLKARVAKSKELKTVTDQLIQMGLNKDLYKQIVEAGALDFAKSIIEGGSEAVSQLNVLADEASKQAMELATQVGAVLYDEGITFAQSVVDGLVSQESYITDMLNRVADEFAAKISAAIAAGAAQQEAANALADAQAAQKKAAAALKAAKPGSAAAKKAQAALTAANKTLASAQKAATATASSGPSASFLSSAATAGYAVSSVGRLLKLAKGGFVTGPTPALVGEAGPEVVTPLKDFERMMGINGSSQTIQYYAAPNNSLDAEQALLQALKRAKVVGQW